nr:type II toxin-antitoxin system Phd/YefM family antitoxin [Demequina sp. NBRC 110051]
MKSVSARDFNRDVSAVKRSAEEGPVVITDRGTPAFVLMGYRDCVARSAGGMGFAELLTADDDLDLELPARSVEVRASDL